MPAHSRACLRSLTMSLPLCPWWLDVETIGATTVLRFTERAILDERTGSALAKYLLRLTAENRLRLVLNFARVAYLDSMMMSKLLGLHKKLTKRGGRLALCRISPPLYELFEVVKLSLLLPIYDGEDEALQALERSTSSWSFP